MKLEAISDLRCSNTHIDENVADMQMHSKHQAN